MSAMMEQGPGGVWKMLCYTLVKANRFRKMREQKGTKMTSRSECGIRSTKNDESKY
jgi:hypothetical protein